MIGCPWVKSQTGCFKKKLLVITLAATITLWLAVVYVADHLLPKMLWNLVMSCARLHHCNQHFSKGILLLTVSLPLAKQFIFADKLGSSLQTAGNHSNLRHGTLWRSPPTWLQREHALHSYKATSHEYADWRLNSELKEHCRLSLCTLEADEEERHTEKVSTCLRARLLDA